MIALAFGPGSGVLMSGTVVSHFLFHRVPAGLSSSRMPAIVSPYEFYRASAKFAARRARPGAPQ